MNYADEQCSLFRPDDSKCVPDEYEPGKSLADILHQIQMYHVFPDCKEFVDMPMKYNPETIHEKWRQLIKTNDDLTTEILREFVFEHYDLPGTDSFKFDKFDDYTPEPPILQHIEEEPFKEWAITLNNLWPVFGLRTIPEIKQHPERYTLIHQNNPSVVPGGRFRECYYWDTFWIIKGLLLCGMTHTARGMIQNFSDLVERFGYIPNGTRTYYLNRSQPPLFCEMVYEYYCITKDTDFVNQKLIDTIEKEYNWWMDTDPQMGHAVVLKFSKKFNEDLILNRFNSSLREPRPESYREDLQIAKELEKEFQHAKKSSQDASFTIQDFEENLFAEIGAACETGWDFSSRWFKDQYHIKTIHTRSIIPVDLNSIIYKLEKNLNFFYTEIIKDEKKSEYYKKQSEKRSYAINKYLWNEKKGQWFDYNFTEKKQKEIISSSNYFPLWAELFTKEQGDLAVSSLTRSELLRKGGLVSSMLYTRQQWDYPNAWPPLQWFIVMGLRKVKENNFSEIMAKELAIAWLYSNFAGYELSKGKMYEKYDVRVWGYRGFGGEYEPQDGFGWSNGVIMCFLEIYGKHLKYDLFKTELEIDDKEYRESIVMRELKNQFKLDKGALRFISRKMYEAIDNGLEKYENDQEPGTNSIPMLPTFVNKLSPTCKKLQGPVLAVHLGTGNLMRITLFEMKSGHIIEHKRSKIVVPENIQSGTSDNLFEFLANEIKIFVVNNNLLENNEVVPLGFVLAFALKSKGIREGYLSSWSKSWRVSGMEDKNLVQSLENALLLKDIKSTQIKVAVLVNDTVGTLVSRLYSDPACQIGMIVGHGTNMCFWERIENIKKIHGDERYKNDLIDEEMIVNSEWGCFGDDSFNDPEGVLIHRTLFDEMVDTHSKNPGKHLFEKMVSGMYLGEICRYMLRHLMLKKTIRKIDGLEKPGSFKTEHMARIIKDTSDNLDDVKEFIKSQFKFDSMLPERKRLREIGILVIKRAARLVAAGGAAVLYKKGLITSATVAADGAVFELFPIFQKEFQHTLLELGGTNVQVRLTMTTDGYGRGAAILAKNYV